MNPNIPTALKSIPIDRESPVSLREQLGQGIADLIGSGRISPEQRLPSIKELAELTGIGPSTVQLVVADLVRRRLVYTKRKSGIFVAQARSGLTQILVWTSYLGERYRLVYFHQILEGLEAGYADPGRRFIMTIGVPQMGAPEELVHDALSQGVDGVVADDPDRPLMAAFAKLAPTLGFVSLLADDPDPRGDQVEADPSAALREVLLERIVAGRKHFAYVAFPRRNQGPAHSPQTRLQRTFQETIQAAHLHQIEIATEDESDFVARIQKLPKGCVIVAESARPAMVLSNQERRLDVVAYTDFRGSLEILRGRYTVMYLGLELLAREAVALLKTTAERLATGQGRVRRVPAVIYRPGKTGLRTTACPPKFVVERRRDH